MRQQVAVYEYSSGHLVAGDGAYEFEQELLVARAWSSGEIGAPLADFRRACGSACGYEHATLYITHQR